MSEGQAAADWLGRLLLANLRINKRGVEIIV